MAVWVGNVPDGTTAYANRACEQIVGQSIAGGLPIDEQPAAYGLVTRDGKPYPVEKLPFSRVVQTGAPVVVDDLVFRRDETQRLHPRVRFAGRRRERQADPRHRRVLRHLAGDRRPGRAPARRGAPALRVRSRPDRGLDDRRGGRDHDVGGRGAAVARREIGRARRQEAAGRLRRAPDDPRIHPPRLRRRVVLVHRRGRRGRLPLLAGAAARSVGRGGRAGRPVARHQRASPPAADDDAERSGDGARDAGGERGARDQQPAHVRPRARRGRGAGAGRAREAGRPARGPGAARREAVLAARAPGIRADPLGHRTHRRHHPRPADLQPPGREQPRARRPARGGPVRAEARGQGGRSARAPGPRPAGDAARQRQRRAPGPGGAEPDGERDAGAPRRQRRGARGRRPHRRRGHRRVRRSRRLRARRAGRGSRAHLRALLLDEGDRRRHRAGAVRLPQHRARSVGRRDRVGSSGGRRGVQGHRARDRPAPPPAPPSPPRPRRATGGGSGRAPHRPRSRTT